LDERLENGFTVLLVVSKVWKEERDARVLVVVLTIISVVMGWICEEGSFRWKDRVENDHSPGGTVQPTRSCSRNSISMHSMQNGC